MRRWILPVYLIVLTTLATQPLWGISAPFYFFDDGFLHLFRIFEFDRVLHQGIFYPRWAPDLAYGYGYPIFNFYPPLAYFVAETIHLFGLSIPDAMKALFVLVIVIGAAGAYALGAELFRDEKPRLLIAALVGVAYVFFPYFLIDIYIRGALAECFAAAFLPWLVWSLRRTLRRQNFGAIIWLGLFSALLVLSHNLTAFLSVPFLGTYALIEILALPRSSRRLAIMRAAFAVTVGALLSAIYWLPLVSEVSLVAVSRSSAELAVSIQSNTQRFTDVIQFSPSYQYHKAPFPLPLVSMVLSALAGLLAIALRRRLKSFGAIIFFASVVLIGTILLTDVTKDLWLGVPFLRSVQFPWRVSTFIGLGSAVAIGSLLASLTASGRFQQLSTRLALYNWLSCGLGIGLGILLIWVGLANLSPVRLSNPREPISIAQLIRFESDSRNIGLGTMDEYLPLTVKFLPQRLNRVALADTAPTITLEQYAAPQRVFTVSASQPVSVSLHAFYFPDWQATVDDKVAPTYPSTPMGILTLDVLAGTHRVQISLTDTLPRRLGVILSLIGAMSVVLLIGLIVRQRDPDTCAILIVSGIMLSVVASTTWTALTAHPPALQPTQIAISPELNLIGLRIEDAQGEANIWRIADQRAWLNVQAYWHVTRSLEERPIAWRLVDERGKEWTRREQLPRYATGMPSTWVPNEIVEDHYNLPLRVGMPPGRYTLQIRCGDHQEYVAAGVIELERGSAPSVPEPSITRRANARIGDQIYLLGYNIVLPPRAGQILPITLYWETKRDILEDLTGFVHLLDEQGKIVAQRDGLPNDGFYTTILWAPNTTIPDPRDLPLPVDLTPGLYRLVAGLYRFETLERLPVTSAAGDISPDDVVELGAIKVPMNAQNVQPEKERAVSFGSTIRLLGYGLQTSREQAILKLYWQARDHVSADYKVFVHVVDEQGQVVAQQDRFPSAGKYPTRIWNAGEKIVDVYTLSFSGLTAGRYTIVVGMYAPDSGERLIAVDADGKELQGRQAPLEQIAIK